MTRRKGETLEQYRKRASAASRQWYADHPNQRNKEAHRAAARRYRAAHLEEVTKAQAEWRAANPDKVRDATLRWRAANPDRVRQNEEARRTGPRRDARSDQRAQWYGENRDRVLAQKDAQRSNRIAEDEIRFAANKAKARARHRARCPAAVEAEITRAILSSMSGL